MRSRCSAGTVLAAALVLSCSTWGAWPGGIGAVLRHSAPDGRLTIESILPGGTAAEAGLREGDRIVEIDGRPVADMEAGEIVRALRGEVGAKVRLVVAREGSDALEIEVVRAPYI
ncbi:MAG: PDZ domain-containing protein [Myxococcota bacterium]|nr:PDZ domain-containing protein [Myxococcota bacterium]